MKIKKYKKCICYASLIVLLSISFLIGYIYSGFKFIPPHFHANFAMYIGEQRVDFSLDKYQEDVAGCNITGLVYPKDRVHLHENNPDIIHVHDDGVAWGHFFANNGFIFNETLLSLDTGEILQEDNQKILTFVLNGEQITNPFNKLIKSEDRLLIHYGEPDNQKLTDLFKTVYSNAGEYNNKYDPGSCGGTNENGLAVLVRDLFFHKH